MLPDWVSARALSFVRGVLGFFATLRGPAPQLGARWVEVSREAPSGDPLTFARPSTASEATRDIALCAARVHRIPHPLGRVPEGIMFWGNSAGLPLAEGEHTASHLTLIPAVDTSVRLAVL